MSRNKLKYFIPNCVDVTDYIFEKCNQSSPIDIKESLDKTKCVLKFEVNNIPYSLMNKGCGPYNHRQILTILQGIEWIR